MVIRRARYPGGTHNSRGEAGALVGIASAAVGSVQETQGSRHAERDAGAVGYFVDLKGCDERTDTPHNQSPLHLSSSPLGSNLRSHDSSQGNRTQNHGASEEEHQAFMRSVEETKLLLQKLDSDRTPANLVEAGERLEQGKATHVSANATDASQGSEGNLGASSQQAIPIDLSGKNASRQEDAPAQGAHTRETVADSTLLAFPVGERCTVGEQTSNPERKDAATECMCNLFNSVLLHEKIQCESCNFAFKAVKKAQNVQEILSRIQGFKVPDSRPPPPPQAIGIEERLSVTHRSLEISGMVSRNLTNDRCGQSLPYAKGLAQRLQTLSHGSQISNSLTNDRSPATFEGKPPCIYPFSHEWDAVPVRMKDVTEDGMPPDQRATDLEHVVLAITVKSLHHLPKLDPGFGKCDAYVHIKLLDQEFQTSVQKSTYDATFEETFELFVHAVNVKTALQEGNSDLSVTFTCHDHDLFGSDMIGSTQILLSDLLSVPDEQHFRRNLFKHGKRSKGHDGELTELNLSCARTEDVHTRPNFEKPTLDSILAQSDSNVFPTAMKVFQNHRSDHFKIREHVTPSSHLVSQDAAEDDKVKTRYPEMYWRQRLEQWLESLTCNIIVMLLVLADVINVLVTILGSGEDTNFQKTVTFIVLALFFIELSLRMLAQGKRFHRSHWNLFDLVIIYSSIGFAVALQVLSPNLEEDEAGGNNGGIQAARNTTTPLRVFSRVAMGLRVLRVLLHMRKVNKLQGNVATRLRTAVSQNKRRYIRSGFDLDLTYITDRVIAMSAPALGGHSAYRNDIHVVSRFLSTRHYGSFFVFNLCDTFVSSDGAIGNYHAQMFFNQVQRIPFEDHGPPLLNEMIHFCREATRWLCRDLANVIAVHCKGGKGRTGVMIAAFLLWCGHRQCAMDAMELFTFRRTENYDPQQGVDESVGGDSSSDSEAKVVKDKLKGKMPNRGVDGPSQQRYVFYIEAMLYCGVNPYDSHTLVLESLSLPLGKPQEKEWWVSYTIRCQRTLVLDSFSTHGTISFYKPREHSSHSTAFTSSNQLVLPVEISLNGDTKIEFFRHDKKTESSRKLIWFVVFHPAFYENKKEIVFAKKKIDMLHKDRKCKYADDDFKLTLSVGTNMSWNRFEEPDNDSSANHTSAGCLLKFGQSSKVSLESWLIAQQELLGSVIETQNKMMRFFRTYGRWRKFRKGDIMIEESAATEEVMMIDRGVVEAVISSSGHETGTQQHYHACGSPIPDDDSLRSTVRVPMCMVQGRGCIIGLSNFLCSPLSVAFRARTDVSVYVFQRRADSTEPEANSPEPCRQASLSQILPEEIKNEIMPDSKNLDRAISFALRGQVSDVMAENDDNEPPAANANASSEIVPSHSDVTSKGAKAWLVRKRLNLLQIWWRVLVIDPESNCIINKQMDFSSIPDVDSAPAISQDEMLHGDSKERKRLNIDDIDVVINFSCRSSKSILKFKTPQRPYQIEFLDPIQRNDFIKCLARVLPESSFVWREPPGLRSSRIKESDYCLEGVPLQDLPDFWQGVAIKMAHQFDRTRTESIRISNLKALTDRDTLMAVYDEGETLRLDCIRIFKLPVSEKLVVAAQCWLTSEDMKIQCRRIRLIIFLDNIVFDQEIFGPNVSRKSIQLRLDQIYQIFDPYKKAEGELSFCLKLIQSGPEGDELVELRIDFGSASTYHEIRTHLAEMCARSEQLRVKRDEKPILDGSIKSFIDKCAVVHVLKNGQEFHEARSNSLFVVRKGSVILACDKFVYRVLHADSCFGETNLIKGESSSQFTVISNSDNTEILELRRIMIRQHSQNDQKFSTLFWFIMCKIVDAAQLEVLDSIFPGTWSSITHRGMVQNAIVDRPSQSVPYHANTSKVLSIFVGKFLTKSELPRRRGSESRRSSLSTLEEACATDTESCSSPLASADDAQRDSGRLRRDRTVTLL